jgi:hypothetical protein
VTFWKASCILIVLCPAISFAEIVTTTDGRTITLNDDGTYTIEASTPLDVDAYVAGLEPFFEHHVSQYQQQSIRFMPKFTNISATAIVGIRFNSSFRDAFGDEIFSFSGDMSERIAPNANSTGNVFYVFENNQFMSGEPYDKLLPMITGDTGSIITIVTGLAMAGGEVVSFR